MCFLQEFALSVSICHLGLAPSGLSRQFAVAWKGERLPVLVEMQQSETTSPRSLGLAGRALWAYELYGITPDIMTVAKPLGGGLPIGAILMTQAVADTLNAGDHGTTSSATGAAAGWRSAALTRSAAFLPAKKA